MKQKYRNRTTTTAYIDNAIIFVFTALISTLVFYYTILLWKWVLAVWAIITIVFIVTLCKDYKECK